MSGADAVETEFPKDSLPSGVDGLDLILRGGLPLGRTTLIEGSPGTGKTTLALQFMIEAARRGENALFMSVAQTDDELDMIANSHGFDLSGVSIRSPEIDVIDGSVSVGSDAAALSKLLSDVEAAVREVNPTVFVFDSLLELRLLSDGPIAYRRNMLRLRHVLAKTGVTALLLDHVAQHDERYERGVVHGVISLETATPDIGTVHRRLSVVKMRGRAFRAGYHDFRIERGGLKVYPRVIPAETESEAHDLRQLEVPEETLNRMLGGGLEFGTTTLISGQAGSGKSTTATLFAVAGARHGTKSALFLFEERPEVFRTRSRSLGLSLEDSEAAGTLELRHFDPAEISPGEFSRSVISAVDAGARIVVIDSLSGYLNALPEKGNVLTHLHTLLQYLSRRGCLVIVTLAQKGLLGEEPVSDVDSSYLADSVILLRQYAARSVIRRSIAVLKKRHGPHERGIQELVIRPGAVEVAELSDETADRSAADAQLTGD